MQMWLWRRRSGPAEMFAQIWTSVGPIAYLQVSLSHHSKVHFLWSCDIVVLLTCLDFTIIYRVIWPRYTLSRVPCELAPLVVAQSEHPAYSQTSLSRLLFLGTKGEWPSSVLWSQPVCLWAAARTQRRLASAVWSPFWWLSVNASLDVSCCVCVEGGHWGKRKFVLCPLDIMGHMPCGDAILQVASKLVWTLASLVRLVCLCVCVCKCAAPGES